jgi:hypothetical protein
VGYVVGALNLWGSDRLFPNHKLNDTRIIFILAEIYYPGIDYVSSPFKLSNLA